jgi:3-hydroxymyristoyl/3-hydroxydecanoyl-(acyl carrier protein) dehydratase
MDCVGPMVPMEDFDEPAVVQDRFKLICDAGATPGAFGGLPPLALEPLDGDPGKWLRTRLLVPVAAPFFADHFPRRPVFPGTLLMHANLQAAARLAAEVAAPRPGTPWLAHRVSDVKLRTFIAPGAKLEIKATVTSRSDDSLHVEVETRNEKALVGSADVQFGSGDLS